VIKTVDYRLFSFGKSFDKFSAVSTPLRNRQRMRKLLNLRSKSTIANSFCRRTFSKFTFMVILYQNLFCKTTE